jgi:hypothetical protein
MATPLMIEGLQSELLFSFFWLLGLQNDSIEIQILSNQYLVYRFVTDFVGCECSSIEYSHEPEHKFKLSNFLFADIGCTYFNIHQVEMNLLWEDNLQSISLPTSAITLQSPYSNKQFKILSSYTGEKSKLKKKSKLTKEIKIATLLN